MSENTTVTATPTRVSVAEELRALLARRRTSATELARQMGVTQPYLSRRMTGEIAFDLDDLDKVARVLEIETVDLLRAAATRPTLTSLDQSMILAPDRALRPFRNSAPSGGRPSNRTDRHGPASGPRRTSRVSRPLVA